jgi:hypothetical protein
LAVRGASSARRWRAGGRLTDCRSLAQRRQCVTSFAGVRTAAKSGGWAPNAVVAAGVLLARRPDGRLPPVRRSPGWSRSCPTAALRLRYLISGCLSADELDHRVDECLTAGDQVRAFRPGRWAGGADRSAGGADRWRCRRGGVRAAPPGPQPARASVAATTEAGAPRPHCATTIPRSPPVAVAQ